MVQYLHSGQTHPRMELRSLIPSSASWYHNSFNLTKQDSEHDFNQKGWLSSNVFEFSARFPVREYLAFGTLTLQPMKLPQASDLTIQRSGQGWQNLHRNLVIKLSTWRWQSNIYRLNASPTCAFSQSGKNENCLISHRSRNLPLRDVRLELQG